MRGAFADALHVVFVAALVIVLVGMLTVALMPGGKPADIRDAGRTRVLPEPVLADGEMLFVGPDGGRAEVGGVTTDRLTPGSAHVRQGHR